MRFAFACLALALAQAPAAAQGPSCAYDLQAMLALDEHAFDRTPDSGWRPLSHTPGCEGAAADLIARYRAAHPEISDPTGLLHHEAQVRAAIGQTETAIALLEQTRALETQPEILAYRDAELAFLRGDRAGLMAARERLLAVPAPEGFEQSVARFRQRYPDLPPPSWPINTEVVNGFVACFDRPYREAYTTPCRGSDVRD